MSSKGNNAQIILDSRGQEVESLFQISQILDTGLDRRVLALLLDLIETGVHPEALAGGYIHCSHSFNYF
jgi:hypothetical protein